MLISFPRDPEWMISDIALLYGEYRSTLFIIVFISFYFIFRKAHSISEPFHDYSNSSPCPTPNIIPAFLTASAIRTQSLTLVAIGFSHSISYPCSVNARTTGQCIRSCTATITASARRFPVVLSDSADAVRSSSQEWKTRLGSRECAVTIASRVFGRGSAMATTLHLSGALRAYSAYPFP